MGFHITHINGTTLNEYIGSNTINSCADKGAFNSPVSQELEEMANQNESIMAIVDEDGVQHFLDTLKSGEVHGRDVQMLIDIVSDKYREGFIIRY